MATTRVPGLATLELPFAYEEHRETKSALVKVVLYAKCVKKMPWKRTREKERAQAKEETQAPREDKARRDGDGDDHDEERRRRADRAHSLFPRPRKRDANHARCSP